jgi:cation:H+ antiporter
MESIFTLVDSGGALRIAILKCSFLPRRIRTAPSRCEHQPAAFPSFAAVVNCGRLEVSLCVAPRTQKWSNHAMERTATRRTTSFSMTFTTSPAAERAPARSSSACSRHRRIRQIMHMSENLTLIGLALLLLFIGAEALVRGSASLALRAGLSPLMVGLTIVAFGTSSPELFASVKAALSHQGDIAVGNVVGSNSFNIGVILGLAALVCPIPVHSRVIKIDAPIALAVALLLPFLLLNHTVGRVEGLLLVGGIVVYTSMNIVLARRQARTGAEDSTGAPVPGVSRHWGMDLASIVAGLGLLVFGSSLLVDNSVALAKAFGVSEAVIALTIVAAGTSVPELATSCVAAVRKQPDIAVGNVVGSNVFNILGILGVASVVSPLRAPGVSTLDYVVIIGFTLLLIPLLYTGRVLHRVEGVALLALYGVYIFVLWPK